MPIVRSPKEKRERAVGEPLNLKAERSGTPKSALVRKPYKPGQHGQSSSNRRFSGSDFSVQLKEKQKLKLTYDLKEKQLRAIFTKAIKSRSKTESKLIALLESRFDNVVFRLGFTLSRITAKQSILHGHLTINGRRVTYPGCEIKIGDVISFHPDSKTKHIFKSASARLTKYEVPVWLMLDREKLEGKMVAVPSAVVLKFDLNLIVGYYSR